MLLVANFARVRYLGLAIRHFENSAGRDSYHSAILYKLDDTDPRIFHLAWHHDLRDELPNAHYLWANVALDDLNRHFIAAWIGARQQHEDKIPYGLDASGSCFNVATGEFIPPPIGKGLTCATLIVAVFRSLGFEVLDERTWMTRASDVEWQAWALETMVEHNVPADHIQAVQDDVGIQRFRPEEVVGAGVNSPWPVAFTDAQHFAAAVLADVQAARY